MRVKYDRSIFRLTTLLIACAPGKTAEQIHDPDPHVVIRKSLGLFA